MEPSTQPQSLPNLTNLLPTTQFPTNRQSYNKRLAKLAHPKQSIPVECRGERLTRINVNKAAWLSLVSNSYSLQLLIPKTIARFRVINFVPQVLYRVNNKSVRAAREMGHNIPLERVVEGNRMRNMSLDNEIRIASRNRSWDNEGGSDRWIMVGDHSTMGIEVLVDTTNGWNNNNDSCENANKR